MTREIRFKKLSNPNISGQKGVKKVQRKLRSSKDQESGPGKVSK